jgi:hypothetical protein
MMLRNLDNLMSDHLAECFYSCPFVYCYSGCESVPGYMKSQLLMYAPFIDNFLQVETGSLLRDSTRLLRQPIPDERVEELRRINNKIHIPNLNFYLLYLSLL